MKASLELKKQIEAAKSLSTDNRDKFTVRLCEKLLKCVNRDATLTKSQAEFLGDTIGIVSYEFMPGRNVRYQDASDICPLLVMQLATYINSCQE